MGGERESRGWRGRESGGWGVRGRVGDGGERESRGWGG